jgi:hypothetical protein
MSWNFVPRDANHENTYSGAWPMNDVPSHIGGGRPLGPTRSNHPGNNPRSMNSAGEEEEAYKRTVAAVVARNVAQTSAVANQLHNQRQQQLNHWNRQMDYQLNYTMSTMNAQPNGGRSDSQATYDRCHDNVNMMDQNCVYSYTYTSDI